MTEYCNDCSMAKTCQDKMFCCTVKSHRLLRRSRVAEAGKAGLFATRTLLSHSVVVANKLSERVVPLVSLYFLRPVQWHPHVDGSTGRWSGTGWTWTTHGRPELGAQANFAAVGSSAGTRPMVPRGQSRAFNDLRFAARLQVEASNRKVLRDVFSGNHFKFKTM